MIGKFLFIAGCSAAVGLVGLAGCGDKSTGTDDVVPAAAIGVWIADTSIPGEYHDEKFHAELTLDSSGNYKLFRSKLTWSSAEPFPDTSIENGKFTFSKNAFTLTSTTCQAYSANLIVEPCDCSVGNPPHTIPYTITNNSWVITVIGWTSPIDFRYILKKQP